VLQKCKAIVLKTTKFSDSSVIVTCFTDLFGKISFIVNGIHSPKSKTKIAFFQLFNLLELEVYYKLNREIQRIKEVQIGTPLVSLQNQIAKSSISFFLSELIIKILKEHETNEQLYFFVENSIKTLDLLTDTKQVSNFHLIFLIQLSKFIGFFPLLNFSEQNCYFDLQAGKFVDSQTNSTHVLNLELSKILYLVVSNTYHNQPEISRKQRTDLLESLILYYNLHLQSTLTIKSLSVLSEIFN
jgi:DNA repair protein RecO (recombination protein O)